MFNSKNRIKRLFWLYFIILIIEGGLRRWIFPEFATNLLIIRDPIAIIILIIAFKNNLIPKNSFLGIVIVISILCFFSALFFGHGNLIVALFGLRILILHFPLIFIFGGVLDREDIIYFGKVILIISIPMVILITVQFYSPQSAFVNKGLGFSTEGGGFQGTGEYFRPPGTFSFITGVSSFFTIVGCFVLYFWLETKKINFILLIASSIALIVSIPTSISRSLFFSILISFIFFIISISVQKNFLRNLIQFTFFCIILFLVSTKTNSLDTQIDAFSKRFNSANETESNGKVGIIAIQEAIIGRFLYSTVNDIDESKIIFGYGIGAGTNVGSKLLTGKISFVVAEGEIARIMGECGLILGLIIVLVRIIMTYNYSLYSIHLFRLGDNLPLMLLSIGFIYTFMGGWAQPSALGFYVVIVSLWIASLK